MLCKVFWINPQSFPSYGIIPLVGAQIYTGTRPETGHRQHLFLSAFPDSHRGSFPPRSHLYSIISHLCRKKRKPTHCVPCWIRTNVRVTFLILDARSPKKLIGGLEDTSPLSPPDSAPFVTKAFLICIQSSSFQIPLVYQIHLYNQIYNFFSTKILIFFWRSMRESNPRPVIDSHVS